jgi:hypothetical protein
LGGAVIAAEDDDGCCCRRKRLRKDIVIYYDDDGKDFDLVNVKIRNKGNMNISFFPKDVVFTISASEGRLPLQKNKRA